MRKEQIGIVGLGLLLLAGCAVPAEQLDPVSTEEVTALVPEGPRPRADYTLRCFNFADVIFPKLIREGSKRVEAVLTETGSFETVRPGIGTEEVHLSMVLREEAPNLLFNFFSSAWSGMSLLTLPAWWDEEFVLTVEVSRAGHVLKSYSYRNGFTVWIQLFLLPISALYTADRIFDAMLDNMLRHLARDLLQDGVLEARDP